MFIFCAFEIAAGQQQELSNLLQRKMAVDEEFTLVRKKESNLQQKYKDKSQELKDTKERAQKKEEQSRALIKNLEEANEGFRARCTDLLNDLEKVRAREAQWKNEKAGIDAKIKNLQTDLTEARQQMEDMHIKTTELSTQLAVKETELTHRETDVTRLRKELQELQNLYKQSTEHAAQQAELIQQLQALNMDTQKVLRNQEDAHTAEVLSYQKLYNELNAGYEALKSSETQLRQSHTSLKDQLLQKEQQISQLQVQLQEALDALHPPDTVEQEPEQPSFTELEVIIASQKSEIKILQDKLNTANLQLTEQSSCSEDVFNTTMTRAGEKNKEPPVKRSRSLSPKSSFRESEEQRKLKIAERKNEELEKTLQLKSQENAELRRVHEKRKERLYLIQTNYRVLKQQLKELEEGSTKNQGCKISRQRAESWQLRQEDSDAVWNELAHFKKEHKKLLIEKMNLEEELDQLKVQVSMDKATIQELKLCLQQEREELIFRLGEDDGVRNSTPKKSVKETLDQTLQKVGQLERRLKDFERESKKLRQANEELTNEKQSLRASVKRLKKDVESWERESEELQKANVEIMKAKEKLEVTTCELEKEVAKLKKKSSSINELRLENGKLLRQMQMLQLTMDAAKAAITKATKGKSNRKAAGSFAKAKPAKRMGSRRRYQAFLNQSIKVMSGVFENFNQDGWEDVSADSDAEVTSPDSLAEIRVKQNPTTDDELMEEIVGYPQGMNHLYIKQNSKDKLTEHLYHQTKLHPTRRLNSSFIRRVKEKRKSLAQKQGSNFTSLQERIVSLQQLVSVLQNGKRSALCSAREFQKANQKLATELTLANQRLQIGKQMAQKLTCDLAAVQREKEDMEKALDQLREQLAQVKVSTEVLCLATPDQPQTIPDTPSRTLDLEVKQLQSKLKNATNEMNKQSMTMKSLKNDVQDREERIRELQEKVTRMERDVNMKRHLIEDLKSRLKANEESAKPSKEMIENLERKVKTLSEEGLIKKTSVESLKQRLNVATKEKSHYEQLYYKVKDHLEKKNLKVTDLEGKVTEAETAMTELEATASQQLHGLAKQSGQALEMVQKKLMNANSMVEEFVTFVKALAKALQLNIQEMKRQIRQAKKRQHCCTGISKESVNRAQSLAASILNISQTDLEQILDTEDEEEAIKTKEALEQDQQWMYHILKLLEGQFPFASHLMQAVQEKMEEKKRLTEEYYSLVKDRTAERIEKNAMGANA
ncbi:hypothetical protein NDU88_006005 [Pleurodeles waltl]|uniref:Centlein n=1 Tax=Pleurodeles waltl TaxID=8319 RepID=A0AAV7X078_PLEWA|nr:hypothetical protein NDU88_006005 [Pleurodeles waltl]